MYLEVRTIIRLLARLYFNVGSEPHTCKHTFVIYLNYQKSRGCFYIMGLESVSIFIFMNINIEYFCQYAIHKIKPSKGLHKNHAKSYEHFL